MNLTWQAQRERLSTWVHSRAPRLPTSGVAHTEKKEPLCCTFPAAWTLATICHCFITVLFLFFFTFPQRSCLAMQFWRVFLLLRKKETASVRSVRPTTAIAWPGLLAFPSCGTSLTCVTFIVSSYTYGRWDARGLATESWETRTFHSVILLPYFC